MAIPGKITAQMALEAWRQLRDEGHHADCMIAEMALPRPTLLHDDQPMRLPLHILPTTEA